MPEISKKRKISIAERASFLCEYCKSPKAYSPSPFDIEHILPVSKGGKSVLQNLAYSCNGCNCNKSNKTTAQDPITLLEVPLFHPRNDTWAVHFIWDVSACLVIGLTPTGRATVELLRLNRPELINLRGLLALVGKHPPDDTKVKN